MIASENFRSSCLEAVLLLLPRDEVLVGDGDFLLEGVAGQLEHFHAVAQRRRDGVEDVGGGDEHDVREVERHVEVMVAEGEVLLRVEDFEQRGGGVAAEVRAELVNLVEHEDGVVGFGLADSLDDAAGERADVGAAVAADLGLVADAAEGDADEFPAERARDGAPERGLAGAGRPDEAEDRPVRVLLQLAHRQVFEDALLDLVEVVVVLVEDLLRRGRCPAGRWWTCATAAR